MSTRIYNGLISRYGLEQTYLHLIDLKPAMKHLAGQITHQWLANHAAMMLDRMTMSDKAITRDLAQHTSVYSEVVSRLQNAHDAVKKGHRQPGIDFDSKLLLYPRKDTTLIFPIVESGEQLELLKAQDWIDDYGYWDNSDEPEGMTRAEFKARGKEWDNAMGPSGVLDERSLTFYLSSNFDMMVHMTLEGILNAMPTIEERTYRYVRDEMRRIAFDRMSDADKEELKTSPYLAMSKANAYLETEEAEAERVKLREKVLARLKPISEKEILGPASANEVKA